jgi:hypothetical protein
MTNKGLPSALYLRSPKLLHGADHAGWTGLIRVRDNQVIFAQRRANPSG